MPPHALLLFMVALTSLFRIAEIILGEINARKMLREAGKEFSPWQRPVIVIIYAAWLAVLIFTAPADAPIVTPFLILFFLLQIFRWWCIAHLKNFWTTRIIIMPMAFKIISGPYRFMKHPIYWVLGLEVFALSFAFHQWLAGFTFGILTLIWIYFRIKAENRALMMML